jgi:hypothetical protein
MPKLLGTMQKNYQANFYFVSYFCFLGWVMGMNVWEKKSFESYKHGVQMFVGSTIHQLDLFGM